MSSLLKSSLINTFLPLGKEKEVKRVYEEILSLLPKATSQLSIIYREVHPKEWLRAVCASTCGPRATSWGNRCFRRMFLLLLRTQFSLAEGLWLPIR